MAQQFVLPYVHNTFLCEQALPEYFEDYFKSENDFMYLTGNDRLRYKTVLSPKDGRWVVWDLEWQAFVSANVPDQTADIHFIKQGQDEYYVTVYAKDGSECAGYDRRTIGRRMIRCLTTYDPSRQTLLAGDFIQDMWQPSYKLIYATDMVFYVKNERVKPYADRVVRMNSFSGDGWDDFIETSGIESGQRLAFTNLEMYRLSVVVLGGDGMGLSKEDIRYQLPKRTPRPAFFRDRTDLRLQHLCSWGHHEDHVNEDHVLYTRFTGKDLKLVYDFDETQHLRSCSRAKLVHMNAMGVGFQMAADMVFKHDEKTMKDVLNIKGNWLQFGKDCAFDDGRMMRLKLVRIQTRYVAGSEDRVPVFHVC